MIGEIRKQAKEILHSSYKEFLPTLLVYIAVQAALYIITTASPFGILGDYYKYFEIPILALFLIIELVALPILTTVLVKKSLDCVNCSALDTSVKKFLNKQNVKNIILINLIQGIFNIFYFTANQPSWSHWNIFGLKSDSVIGLLLIFLNLYIWYRFLICKYIFIQFGGSAKDTLSKSFKLMKGKFFKYILLILSFIPWILFFVFLMVISVIAGNLFESFINSGLPYLSSITLNLPIKVVVVIIAVAMELFLMPYMYLAEVLFIKNSLAEEKTKGF